MAVRSTKRVTALVLRLCLGALLVYSGGEKLFRLDDFTRDVANYRVVMPPWDAVAAYVLPCFELATGLCLLLGILVQGALLIAAALTATFMVAVGQAWYFGLNINCGCFGPGDQPTHLPLHLALLVVMLGVIVFLFVAERWARNHVFGGKRLKLPG
jgi:uncharacterized membrane protein YphA (DoxX/SURF4 family)